jgi:uncharacterized membrane protein YedE/YeeE
MNEYLLALSGGMLIGLSASILLVSYGRILGVSGILGGFINSRLTKETWRFFFLLGIFCGGFIISHWVPENFSVVYHPPIGRLVVAGLLVGFGTQIANGCTSGHGVCGVSRLSKRSIIATMVFIGSGMLTVFLLKFIG